MTFPEGLKYTEHDEWVSVDGDIATVGITDYAQDQLGELVHVELPKVGKTIAQGAVICEVESVKAVAEVYSPVSGTVIEVNGALDDAAEQINADPYGSWIFKVRLSAPVSGLMDSATYRAKIGK
jgi:glycine cleavage system H protein